MSGFDPVYSAAYFLTIAGLIFVSYTLARHSRMNSVSLGPRRFFGLTKDEGSRLLSGDAVYLMHLSIAIGVGLSILDSLLDPLMNYLPWLRTMFLLLSLPIVAGLAAAFAWRIQRYIRSKDLEKEFSTGGSFSNPSTVLQLILMLAIVLTASELVLMWFPAFALAGALVGVFRNVLVALYYTRPSVNLIGYFDKPLSFFSTPFKLADVMTGKTEPDKVRVGAARMSDFSSAQKLSFDSCVEIGACEAACPATAAGRPLSPRVLVRKLSLLEGSRAGIDPDPLSSVGGDELWSCTSCGACVSSCPVGVKHLDVIYDLRRELVVRGKLDKEKSGMLENLAKNKNPYGFKNSTRGDWALGLGVDTISSAPNAEYVYWVGCISSFDQRAQKVARALAKILKHAGVSFAILGPEEMCVGDPARRLGEEGRYQELVYQNIEVLGARNVKKIIATCPHCFNALRNEYPNFGGKYEVLYHTQLISDLIRSGRLKVPREKIGEVSVTLHDACYAARYNSIFDEPREILGSTSRDVREMGRRKEKTFCCGAGGSNYWFKVPQQRSIAGIRTEEAMKTGAKEIATECPYCLSMLDDATKAMNSGMQVRDVAEIVADSLSDA
jgi:Fe-S oxidoreductase